MKQLIPLSLIFICCSSFAFIAPKKGDKTKDIAQYALTHSEFPKRGFDRFDCGNCKALKNLIFVAPISTCGTGSCDYMMFENKDSDATYITTVNIKPGSFEFLKTAHNGLPDLKIYRHMSADSGVITTMEFDGHSYSGVGLEKKITAADLENELAPEKVTPVNLK
jgi:hypothetical protein